MPALSSSTNPGSISSQRLNLHPFRRCADEEIEPEMLCPTCGDALDHAIELTPCGDMFCLTCLESQPSAWRPRLSASAGTPPPESAVAPVSSSTFVPRPTVAECPKCNLPVSEERVPTRVLMNLLLSVRVRCCECGWEGTREASAQHGCCDAVREANAAMSVAYDMKKQEMAALQKKADASADAGKEVVGRTTTGAGDHCVLPLPSAADGGAARSAHTTTTTTTTVVPSAAPIGASANTPIPSITASPGAVDRRGESRATLNTVRRADDSTESALLRNFQTIEDDPNFSTVRRQRSGGTSGHEAGMVGGAGLRTSSEFLRSQQQRLAHSPSARISTSPLSSSCDVDGYGMLPSVNATSPVPLSQLTNREVASPVRSAPPRQNPQPAGGNAGEAPFVMDDARSSLLAPPTEGCWQRYGMTQAEYDQVMGIFLSFDADGVGRLNRTQLFQLCVCLNYVSTREDSNFVFDEIDRHHTGFITLDQFCLWLRDNRPDPDALYGLTPFEYNDAMIQFRVADPTYRGWMEWKDFCQLCLRNRYASTTQDAQALFERCADPSTKTVNLHRYFKLLQTLKQQGFTIGGRTAQSRGGAFPASPGPLLHRSSSSSLTTPPVGGYEHARRPSADSSQGQGPLRASVMSSGSVNGALAGTSTAAAGGTSGIPRPPPRSNPVTGQVISGGRASNVPGSQATPTAAARVGTPGGIPRLHSDASSVDRLNSTCGSSRFTGLPFEGGMVASGGRSTTTAARTPLGARKPESLQRGGKKKNDCIVM